MTTPSGADDTSLLVHRHTGELVPNNQIPQFLRGRNLHAPVVAMRTLLYGTPAVVVPIGTAAAFLTSNFLLLIPTTIFSIVSMVSAFPISAKLSDRRDKALRALDLIPASSEALAEHKRFNAASLETMSSNSSKEIGNLPTAVTVKGVSTAELKKIPLTVLRVLLKTLNNLSVLNDALKHKGGSAEVVYFAHAAYDDYIPNTIKTYAALPVADRQDETEATASVIEQLELINTRFTDISAIIENEARDQFEIQKNYMRNVLRNDRGLELE